MEIVNEQPIPVVDKDAKHRRLNSLVLQAGAATTASTLFGVYMLNTYLHENIMGWYGNYIIPVGAMLVGGVASSGYGSASWYGGLKIQKKLFFIIVGLQLVAYAAAQYIEFHSLGPLFHKSTGTPVGFFEYYHYVTTTIAFSEHGKVGSALGLWGYGVKALEVAGFAGGSLFAPLILSGQPYCDACEVYMKSRQLALFPASVTAKKIKKNDAEGQAAHQAEQKDAFEKGMAHVDFLRKTATENDSAALKTYIAAAQSHKKEVLKLPVRVEVKSVHCKSCSAGHLRFTIFSGQGKQQKSQELPRSELKPEFVNAITEKV